MLGLRATWKLFHYRVSIISLENRPVVELLESTNARPIRHFHNIVKWNITVHCCCCWASMNWMGLKNVSVNISILYDQEWAQWLDYAAWHKKRTVGLVWTTGKLDASSVELWNNGAKSQRDRVSHCVQKTQKRLEAGDLESLAFSETQVWRQLLLEPAGGPNLQGTKLVLDRKGQKALPIWLRGASRAEAWSFQGGPGTLNQTHIPCVGISRFWRAHVKHSF